MQRKAEFLIFKPSQQAAAALILSVKISELPLAIKLKLK
jgi:hypothetical protein